jgi:hypothetical protein
MDLKQGDRVVVDGKTAHIETQWGQGKHRVYKLDDGRQVLDLDKLIASGKAQKIQTGPAPMIRPQGGGPATKKTWVDEV